MEALTRHGRDPKKTRRELLEAAFDEIHLHGFQAASLNRILARTGVTKGALYHHFSSKLALGYAVVDEVLRERMIAQWVWPIAEAEDPVEGFMRSMESARQHFLEEGVGLGCPLNNLAQEMAPIDEGFRARLERVYQEWRDGVAQALRRGQGRGYIRADIDPHRMAVFIVAALEGCAGAAKNARSSALLMDCGAGVVHLVEGLRAGSAEKRGSDE